MTRQFIEDYNALPEEAKVQITEFLAFLRYKYSGDLADLPAFETDLSQEDFVGMWKDRPEFSDSSNWVKELRKNEWG